MSEFCLERTSKLGRKPKAPKLISEDIVSLLGSSNKLSNPELEILPWVAQGMPLEDIAQKRHWPLRLTRTFVETIHRLAHMLSKDAALRAEALADTPKPSIPPDARSLEPLLFTGVKEGLEDNVPLTQVEREVFALITPKKPLTQLQRKVLILINRGHSNSEIAAELQVGLGSVQQLCKSVYGKTGLKRQAIVELRMPPKQGFTELIQSSDLGGVPRQLFTKSELKVITWARNGYGEAQIRLGVGLDTLELSGVITDILRKVDSFRERIASALAQESTANRDLKEYSRSPSGIRRIREIIAEINSNLGWVDLDGGPGSGGVSSR